MKKEYFSPLLEVCMMVVDESISVISAADEPLEDGLSWDSELEEL